MPASFQQKSLLGKFRLTSTLRVETGLHIGGGGENLDIGGLDKPVIRDPLTQQPYLPGSSIKGKLRSILERLLNKPLNRPGGSGTYRYESDDLEDGFSEAGDSYIPFQGAKTCPLSRVFGSTGTNCWLPTAIAQEQDLERIGSPKIIQETECIKVKGRNFPARLIVRDSHLLSNSAQKLREIDTGLYMTEWKFENGIDRITAAANPRQLERVPAGAEFGFELVYTVENAEQAVEDLRNLAIALAILEDDALGGHGSRGYGKVSFKNFKFIYRDINQYRQLVSSGGNNTDDFDPPKDTSELLKRFGEVQALLPSS
ncbi:type III-A CRISPR-associated RAMP protein Csm3 [[Phormidium ambiguum] IAM M-71]|uniref:CRISPR system Cms endoribonuclease Csm3 n=1 Tax=[Phormidium ambiguum] IAM M-71 TaxID=454136 RepID=A0A1U7IFE8_9CYAN|nr:type III-A CRISPR-associated RAMP protein Csm3 [Phormidium ambiguum]OKH35673.1 type III-A CRISPR-associated RAMP protein Csm3 [Phormidium ambiguum IAM M-71]